MNIGGSDTMEKPGYVTVGPVVTVTPTPTPVVTETTVEPEVYTYSMTNTAYRQDENAVKGQLMDPAIDNCNNMKNKLDSLGWKMKIYNEGPAVTKADFDVNPDPGHITLNSAVLHFHVGHGSPKDSNGHTALELLDQNNDGYSLYPSEVKGKWGGYNKWVILDSCYAMQDDDWGRALSTSHGILGFKTQSDVHPRFTEKFFYYAIDEGKTVYEAYRKTTYDLFKDTEVPKNPGDTKRTEKVIAAVYFKDKNQAIYDYLPGVNTGVYTGTNSGVFHRESWFCNLTPVGVV
jgi:hypothetical protein